MRTRFIVAVAALVTGVGAVTVAQVEPVVEHVSVRQGEGLWSVAQRLCPGNVNAQYVSLQQANPWYTVGLKPGTVLHRIEGSCPASGTSTTVAVTTTSSSTTTSTTLAATSTTAPTSTSTTSLPPSPPTGFPTAATAGVPTGTTLTNRADTLTVNTSSLPGTTQTVNGMACHVIERLNFTDLRGGYIAVNERCVVLRFVRVTSSQLTVNTSAMVQGQSINDYLLIDRSDFDGGAMHNRGVQNDHGTLEVQSSEFLNTGNAAVEMNNRDQSADYIVRDSYINEPGGWPPSDHADGLQVGGARSVTIVHNSIFVARNGAPGAGNNYVANSCMGLWAELGNTGITLVENNLMLSCGGSGMYTEQKSPYRWTSSVIVRNNRFGRTGIVWFVLAPVGLPANFTWSGNVWDDNGQTITLAAAQACCVTG